MKLRNTFWGIFILVLCITWIPNLTFSQPYTTDCSVESVTQIDAKTLHFSVYLKNTTANPYEYAGGQYRFTFNKGVLNGGTGTLTIIQTEMGTQAPRNPAVVTTTTPGQLNTAANTPPGAGSGLTIAAGASILVAKFQLVTSASSFTALSTLDLAWRPYTNTSYSIYVGTLNTNITTSGTFILDGNPPLPVQLASFTGNVENKRDVKLTWKTSTEINNKGFEIERKITDGTWSKVGYINGKGTTNAPVDYRFEDKKLNTGKYNYRLKQIDNNGNYEYHNLSTVIEVGIPTKYDMSQNYPNPFNPATKIDFDLPLDSRVSIIMYDISGREVKTLVNDSRTAGYYTIQFNSSGLSSGTYFYRIMTKSSGPDFIMTKKMMLVK